MHTALCVCMDLELDLLSPQTCRIHGVQDRSTLEVGEHELATLRTLLSYSC